jgi:glucan phosphorylase
MGQLDSWMPRTDIGYFSMEIAVHPETCTHGGGLGILAGSAARACADLNSQRMIRRYASEAYLR